MNERDIFIEALQRSTPADRRAYLELACDCDDRLRGRVENLLAAFDQAGSFLQEPSAALVATIDHASEYRTSTIEMEAPGATIGPYTLREQIGVGGMGVVYMAEQATPVRRKVALKVIKPGMDTKQVIARFEAERQTLALMDHPNIAKVHDAGTTDAGRPYFVMELVRGIPITDYSDRERLSIPERLELFVLVCRAVQHAHQKGIIHRDIKPSNVLVTVIDGVAVPKVIDFGVAKATGDPLTDQTLFTGFHQCVGTPLYMSPEQAGISGIDVDTRSDVYSLGVLLYELLTGSTPFDSETFRKAALGELQRIIREDEPPKPSTRLSSLGDELRSRVSSSRQTDVGHLGRAVRGELDWIVMKCLEKDRRRRYETVNGLAADVMRHLTDQPVEACPPSVRYRFGKFSRRHRTLLTTVGLVALALLAGITLSVQQAVRASAAEQRTSGALALAENHLDFARKAVDELYDDVAGRWSDGADSVDNSPLPQRFLEKVLPFYQRFADSPQATSTVGLANLRAARILTQLGRGKSAGQALDRAEAVFHALIALDPANPEHRYGLAQCYYTRNGRSGTAKAIELLERLSDENPEELEYRYLLSMNIHTVGVRDWNDRKPEALNHLQRSREIQERLCTEDPRNDRYRSALGKTLRDLGNVYRDIEQRSDEAELYHRRAFAIHEELSNSHLTRPQFWRDLAWSSGDVGRTLLAAGKYEEVPRYAGRAASIFKALANEYPNAPFRDWQALSLLEVARSQFKMGKRQDAAATMTEVEAIQGAWVPAAEFLVWIACEIGLPPKSNDEERATAMDLLNRSLRLRPEGSGLTWHAIGALHYRLGEIDSAIRELERAADILKDNQEFSTAFWLAMAYHRKGDHEEARKWFDRGVTWMKVHDPAKDAVIDRFQRDRRQLQAESADLMGIDLSVPGTTNAAEPVKPPE